jgi:hypothetical protein
MYTWGSIYQKQNRKYISNIKPVEIDFDTTVQDIVVLPLRYNACHTTDGRFYVWGLMSQRASPESVVSQLYIPKPLEAPFKTMHELFCHYDISQEIHAPLTCETFALNSALKLEMAFTNQEAGLLNIHTNSKYKITLI